MTSSAIADYLGRGAAEAASAIRRTGLRPALERSFGWEPELYGQVVAQEPVAGSELARDSVLVLFVAAPEETPANERGAVHEVQPDTGPVGRADPPAPHDGVTEGERVQRRRRKSHLAAGPPVFPPPPPPPVPPEPDRAAGVPATRGQHAVVLAPELEAPEYVEREDGGLEDMWDEQLMARADQLLATRTGRTAARRGAPRGLRGSLGTSSAEGYPLFLKLLQRRKEDGALFASGVTDSEHVFARCERDQFSC